MDNLNQVPIRKSNNINNSPATHVSAKKSNVRSGSKKSIWTIGSVLTLIVLFFGGYFAIQQLNENSLMRGVNKSEYQAVFLTNGQAYFGKITSIDSNYLYISKIYYLQAQQNGQPAQTQPKTSDSQASLSLVKLGSEIHGPEDSMFIARSQILFYENIKDNGQVVKAINSVKK